MRINEFEENELRELYKVANTTDADKDWQAVRTYYETLGTKYGFDPHRVQIDTKGEVTSNEGRSIFVVYGYDYKKDGNVSIRLVCAYGRKQDAMKHCFNDSEHSWQEIGLY